MILYAHASGVAKGYIHEMDSELAIAWLETAERVATCRIAFVEIYRAIALSNPTDRTRGLLDFEAHWQAFSIVEVDEFLTQRAATLAVQFGLRTLDGLHLAAAERVNDQDMRLMSWDRRLWDAARNHGLSVLPETRP